MFKGRITMAARSNRKWSRERREKFKRTMAMKKFSNSLTKSGIKHTPLNLAVVDAAVPLKLTPIPQDLRDVDSIFGRYQRLSPVGKAFVRAQISKMEGIR
jgi:hypothetical protein